jgi:hypothetical protein
LNTSLKNIVLRWCLHVSSVGKEYNTRRLTGKAYIHSLNLTYCCTLMSMTWWMIATDWNKMERTPVVDRAEVAVIAWKVWSKRALTHSSEQAVVCDGNLALVIVCAHLEVVAWSTECGNAYADTKGCDFSHHCSTETWALVAGRKVCVTVLSTDGASLFWRRDAAALITVATALTKASYLLQGASDWSHYS